MQDSRQYVISEMEIRNLLALRTQKSLLAALIMFDFGNTAWFTLLKTHTIMFMIQLFWDVVRGLQQLEGQFTQQHIIKDLNPQQHCCDSLKLCMMSVWLEQLIIHMYFSFSIEDILLFFND